MESCVIPDEIHIYRESINKIRKRKKNHKNRVLGTEAFKIETFQTKKFLFDI